MKRLFSEGDCQRAQIVYLEMLRDTKREVVFFAVANETIAKLLATVAKIVGKNIAGMVWGFIQKMKSLGMVAGSFDLVILCGAGRVLFIENKIKGGRLSDAQKAMHARARDLGHEVHVITAETPGDAVDKLIAIMEAT